MSNAPETDLTNLPDPSRLIFGLRDTGYDFNTAAADIIDNSIAAGATEVSIQVDLETDGRKFVYFGDNGSGMASAELFDAMRYGAPRRSNLKSLGKFGLGLKTASSSICLKFSLISRKDRNAPLQKLAWDLQHVETENKWEMLGEAITAPEQHYYDELCGDTGTLVVWSKCDRLLSRDYEQPGGAQERRETGVGVDFSASRERCQETAAPEKRCQGHFSRRVACRWDGRCKTTGRRVDACTEPDLEGRG